MKKEEEALLSWDFPHCPPRSQSAEAWELRCSLELELWSMAMWWTGDQAGLLLIPPLLLGLQLLVVWPRLPSPHRGGIGEQGEAVFSVISIEPETRQRGQPALGAGEHTDEEGVRWRGRRGSEGLYEDENEISSRQMGPKALELQPWATNLTSFGTELDRILDYIRSPQLNCSKVLPGEALESAPSAAPPRWLLCADDWLLAGTAPCVAYSFSMDGADAHFQRTVSRLGCEVHTFDPSRANTSGGHLGNALASHGGGVARRHQMWLEWRRPGRKSRRRTRGNSGSVSFTLADIMAALGHHTVHFLYADLLSAEWRVFQNWIESGSLQHVHHVVATVNLQWAGFEVGGTDMEVLRYWFSVLQGLHASGLKLVYSSAGKGHSVLKQTVSRAHSSYTLSWVNTSL